MVSDLMEIIKLVIIYQIIVSLSKNNEQKKKDE